ncbi:hypothetical protein TNCV_3066151 [Trichonephila clavipes]|uniref:Uncharacterized protein n=1 Tax=Trichonephila clavipes TaxID=2585209 RepID=A0A8X6V7W0_TRICX|nr:hypothetical protein TNCV_3066151 [Trichonephila clavipes]
MTAKELAQDIAATTRETTSRQTVYRHLSENALYTRRQVAYPPNTRQRLIYALKERGELLPEDEIDNLICSIRASFGFEKLATFIIRQGQGNVVIKVTDLWPVPLNTSRVEGFDER